MASDSAESIPHDPRANAVMLAKARMLKVFFMVVVKGVFLRMEFKSRGFAPMLVAWLNIMPIVQAGQVRTADEYGVLQ